MSIYINKRGDTIIEVLLASVILSVVLAGAYSLSSRATRLNQSAYERTRASNLVQEQAELLREVQRNDPVLWDSVTAQGVEVYYDCRPEGASVLPDTTAGYDAFQLDVDGVGNVVLHDTDELPPTPVRVTDDIYYTWVTITADTAAYYDFTVYTCWEGLGTIGNQVAGAVIRLESR